MKEEKEKIPHEGEAPTFGETDDSTTTGESPTQIEVQPETSEIERLKKDLEEKAKEVETYKDLYLRERAEAENFKKRLQREKDEALKYENEKLVRELLPVIDNLERATQHAKEMNEGQALREGVEMVSRALFSILHGFGMNPIAAVGETFNPERHEAIAYVETNESGPITVVEEHQKGYFYKERLLRPALVTVAKPALAKEGHTETDVGENGLVEKPETDD